jgi:hypothetical protein
MQHGELLPQSENFQSRVSPATEEDPDYGWDGEEDCWQELHSAT